MARIAQKTPSPWAAHLEEREKLNFRKFVRCHQKAKEPAILRLLGGPWLRLHGSSSHYMGPHGCSSTCISVLHPNPPQGRQKGFGKSQTLKKLQMPLNTLNGSNFGAFGGPWLGLHGPSSHYMGPHGCTRTSTVTK